MKTEWKNREGVLTLSACRKDFPLYIAWTMTYQREMGPPIWRNIVCRQKQNPKMALSKRCATRSDRRCNSVDVLLLSMAHHRTRQANGKSITAGARNKSNPSAEAYHQGKYAEDMLMAHVHSWGWVARHAPYDLIVPGGGVEQRVKVTAGGGPFSFKTQINTHINNTIYVNESSGGQQTCLFFFFSAVCLSLHSRPDGSVLPPAERQRWLGEEVGRRVEVPAPAAVEEQMLGGWHLAEAESSQTLITALNC